MRPDRGYSYALFGNTDEVGRLVDINLGENFLGGRNDNFYRMFEMFGRIGYDVRIVN